MRNILEKNDILEHIEFMARMKRFDYERRINEDRWDFDLAYNTRIKAENELLGILQLMVCYDMVKCGSKEWHEIYDTIMLE